MKEAALAAEPSADGTKAKGKGRGGKGRGKGKKGRGRGKEQAKENKNKDVVEEKKDDEKENENKVEVDEVVPELPKEVEDPPPAIPTEPVPPVPAAKKRARSQKTAPNEGSASSGLPKSSKKIKNGKGEQTAEASHEGKGTQATKRKNKEPETKKTRDGDGVETKKKNMGPVVRVGLQPSQDGSNPPLTLEKPSGLLFVQCLQPISNHIWNTIQPMRTFISSCVYCFSLLL